MDFTDALSRLVFAASNQMYTYGFHNGKQQQKQTQQQHGRSGAAWTLLPFLLSHRGPGAVVW